MTFVEWCNNNQGFITAIFSLLSLLISTTAIVISMSAVQKVRRIHLKLKSSLISPPKIQKEVTF